MTDIGADAWKTGMLSNAEIIQVVAERASHYNVDLLIVDPVMVAKSGDLLLKAKANLTLISKLIPLAHTITPNLHEAHVLTGIEISNINEVQESAVKIFEMGAKNVVVKGGHLQDINESIDILYDGKKFIEFRSPSIIHYPCSESISIQNLPKRPVFSVAVDVRFNTIAIAFEEIINSEFSGVLSRYHANPSWKCYRRES